MEAETFLYCQGWSEAKPGHDSGQNQDAFQTRRVTDAAGESVLLAISDGATETIYAGPWARALAAAAEPDWPVLDDALLTMRLDTVREQFQLTVPADLPWPMAHKLAKQGSQATLVVASLAETADSADVRLQAVAVGDCELIIFRRDGSTAAFPLPKSTDFGLRPQLVSTKPQPGLKYERWDTTLRPGDVLIGCTDAVGKWTLQSVESADGESVIRMLLDVMGDDRIPGTASLASDGDLFGRIAGHAMPRQLEEDDVTFVLCVPVRPDGAQAARDSAQAVLKGHLTGDFEPRPGRRVPVWIAAALTYLRRASRAVLRWAVRIWRSSRRRIGSRQ